MTCLQRVRVLRRYACSACSHNLTVVHIDKHDDMELPDSAEAGAAGGAVLRRMTTGGGALTQPRARRAPSKRNSAILSALLPSAGRRAVRCALHGVACDARRWLLLF